MTARVVIITDLDGSLLDAKSYSFEKAAPALRLIGERDIPLVLCSSKTRAEIEVYRKRLQNRHPFIAENGGALFIPEGCFSFPVEGEDRDGLRVISLGTPYAEVRKQFKALRERMHVPARGFGDMTTAEVAALSGLTRDEAALAMEREYGEPFVFPGAPDERFLRAIEAAGLKWTQGRFFHIMGNHDKGKAVAVLRALYERSGERPVFIGLGDSLNDLPLLLAVDRPVLIRKDDGSHDPRISIPGLSRTDGIGPAGWNEAILAALPGAHE